MKELSKWVFEKCMSYSNDSCPKDSITGIGGMCTGCSDFVPYPPVVEKVECKCRQIDLDEFKEVETLDVESTEYDQVNNPVHYTSHPSGIECIEVTAHMGFCLGNVVKYVWRADLKGEGIIDLEKAMKYLEFEIERRKEVKK